MKMTRKIYWKYSVFGMTLVEVVAAIAILGIIVVGLTLARSSHARQIAASRNLADGVHLVDDLIASWWTGRTGVPINSCGVIGPNGEWNWKTYVVSNPNLDDIGARVVRVEVHHQSNPANVQPIIVDLVLPNHTVAVGDRS